MSPFFALENLPCNGRYEVQQVGCEVHLIFPGAPLTPGRHSRTSSVVDAASSPRVTPRHSRTSSIEALANAASFVQPYKASIIYGAQPSQPAWESAKASPAACQRVVV